MVISMIYTAHEKGKSHILRWSQARQEESIHGIADNSTKVPVSATLLHYYYIQQKNVYFDICEDQWTLNLHSVENDNAIRTLKKAHNNQSKHNSNVG